MKISLNLSPVTFPLFPILAYSILVFPTATMAKPIVVTPKLNCNLPQTQLEINRCSQLSYENADRKLNQVYKQLLPKLALPRQQKLIAAQQAWIKFRDSSCEFERSAFEGGSIAPSIYLNCLETVTKQRLQQLQEYLQTDR